MKIISVGDNVRKGTYLTHSRFGRVINLVNSDGYLISLVTKEIDAGPVNIVVKDVNFNKIQNLKIESGVIHIDDNLLQFDSLMIFDSKISLPNIDKKILQKNLEYLEKEVIKKANDKSLVFILDESRLKNFATEFERNLVKIILSGVNNIYSGKIEEGIKNIRGVGFGLTPSGDDFVAGFLFGLHFANKTRVKGADEIIQQISPYATSQNVISNSFLVCASKGLFFSRLKNLILSLCYEGVGEIDKNTDKLLSIGASSGSDLTVGFLVAVGMMEKGH